MRSLPVLRRKDILDPACCAPPALPLAADDATAAARAFRALGDPTRLQLVTLLARQAEPWCACHLEAAFDLAQPTISHHLKVLRDAGLVQAERRGVWIYYSLDRGRLRELGARLSPSPLPSPRLERGRG
jgi:ArsR family transcriptional regulator